MVEEREIMVEELEIIVLEQFSPFRSSEDISISSIFLLSLSDFSLISLFTIKPNLLLCLNSRTKQNLRTKF